MPELDPRELRDAFGEFMTGVTIITTVDAEGNPHGLTANSFSSVSLEPPMAMFSLGRTSSTFDAFEAGNGFVFHILADDQRDLSMQFAAKGIDKFAGVDTRPGHNGIPVIEGALASFECSQEHVYEGGDHLIYVGRIEAFSVGDRDRPALGYFRGTYVTSPSV